MSMSLDGYIAGPNDEPGNAGGDSFMHLQWYGFGEDGPGTGGSGWGAHYLDESNATGAVLVDRRTVEQVVQGGIRKSVRRGNPGWYVMKVHAATARTSQYIAHSLIRS